MENQRKHGSITKSGVAHFLYCAARVDIINWNCWLLFIVLVCSIQPPASKWRCTFRSGFQLLFFFFLRDATVCWRTRITTNNGLEWMWGWANNETKWGPAESCVIYDKPIEECNFNKAADFWRLCVHQLLISGRCDCRCCGDSFHSSNDNIPLNHFIGTFIPPSPPPRHLHRPHHPHLLCTQLRV